MAKTVALSMSLIWVNFPILDPLSPCDPRSMDGMIHTWDNTTVGVSWKNIYMSPGAFLTVRTFLNFSFHLQVRPHYLVTSYWGKSNRQPVILSHTL
jgi:hypothetical protein